MAGTKPALIKQVAKAGPLQTQPARPLAPVAPVSGATQVRPPKPPKKPKVKRPSLYAGGSGSPDDGGDDNPNPVEPVPIF